MPWLRIDDTAPDDPKVLRAGHEVFGFAVLCAAWSAGKIGKIEDAFVPDYVAQRIAPGVWDELARQATRAGLFSKPCRSRGERGWFVDQTDQLLHMRTNDEVQADREKSRATRQAGPTRDVRLRDGDQCRYCGKTVNWADRVSGRGGTYDHPDPTDRDTFVVACFACNREKSNRTPQQAGMPLLPVPSVALIGPHTAQRFSVPQQGPERAPEGAAPSESASAPGQHAAAATGPLDGPGPICDLPSEVAQTYPRRDGPGRVGEPAPPPRAGPAPPRRTRRGTRGGQKQPPTQGDPKD
jgi:hypothetical protein